MFGLILVNTNHALHNYMRESGGERSSLDYKRGRRLKIQEEETKRNKCKFLLLFYKHIVGTAI